jgi:tRNA nucleotidyltransferase/poly(A) polymerase
MNIKDDFILSKINEGYLVGGAVRDFLCGKTTCDRDIAIRDALNFAQEIANKFDGTLITLDSEFHIYRVVLKDKINYLDISEIQGNSI